MPQVVTDQTYFIPCLDKSTSDLIGLETLFAVIVSLVEES